MLLTYQSKTVSLIRSHMEGNCRKILQDHCFESQFTKAEIQCIRLFFFYLDLKIQHLVPFWVGILLNDLGAQLQQTFTYQLHNHLHNKQILPLIWVVWRGMGIPFCQRSGPQQKGPLDSSCSRPLQTYPSLTGQRHHPLWKQQKNILVKFVLRGKYILYQSESHSFKRDTFLNE